MIELRVCVSCAVEKPLTEYHKHKTSAGGRAWKCKPCRAKHKKEERGRPDVIAKERATRSSWYYERGGKKIVRKNTIAHRNKTGYPGYSDKQARHVNNITQAAVRRGRLVRMPCEICGSHDSEAHHDDYNKPMSVRWLCNQHHRQWHSNNSPIWALK